MKNLVLTYVLRMSKLFTYAFLIQCLTMSLLFAWNGNAQIKSIEEVMVRISLDGVSARDAFKKIEGASDFHFVYLTKEVRNLPPIFIEGNSQSLYDVLLEIAQQTKLEFKQINQNIHVQKSKNQSPLEPVSILDVEVEISGRVTDESGEPLPGVTVSVPGTTIGTATDLDGKYALSVSEGSTLVFSFIGFESQSISVGDRSVVDVVLSEDMASLDEVVVVGYGVQKKSDITGSVSSINSDKIKNFPVTGFQHALAGQASGVQVQQGTGAPGSNPIIRIRGTGSITAGNEPLYVIDGFVGAGNLNSMNMNDIESIEILKDASATAIYGSRGSNGVVLITTKNGTIGRPTVEISIFSGIQQLPKKYDVLNAEQWVEFVVEARDNAWVARGGSRNEPNESRLPAYQYPEEFNNPASFGRGTDFQDEIFHIAPIQNYDLSVSGGTDKVKYFISGNYFNQKGIIKTSGFERYSFRFNTEVNLSKRMKIGVNLSPSFLIEDYVNAEGHWGSNGAVLSALNLPPIFPVYEQDGSYGSLVEYGWNFPSIPSPLIPLYEMEDRRKRLNILGIAYAEFSIMDNLKLKTSINANLSNYRNNTFRTSQAERDGRPAPQPSEASSRTSQSINYLFESTLAYNKEFNDHSLNALAGYTVQKDHFEDNYVFATNFPNDRIRTINAGQVTNGSGTASEWSLISYLGRLNYNYKNKYLITTTIRRDGSSRFGSANKWGIFPSVALGWRISQETFMDKYSFINEFKFRSSYGFSGNNTIPNYGHIGLVGINNYVFGNSVANGVSPSTFSNDFLNWEKQRQFDVGLEVGLFEDRIVFEMDRYISFTTDLLLNVPVPTHTGYGNSLQNIGEVKNSGWEVTVTSRNLVEKFGWNTSLNFSTNKNVVLALGPEGDPIITLANKTEVGNPIGSFFGYVFEGIYNTQAEIEARPSLPTDMPGDPIILDVNDDGIISPDDRTILDSNQPDFIFGFNNSFTYKNFELNLLLQGAVGYNVFSRHYSWLYLSTGFMNVSSDLLNRWKSPEEPGNGKIPHAFADNLGLRRQPSTLWITDASFLRISNLNLGYNLPQTWVRKFSIESAKIYCHGQNLFTFTKFPGYNPEVSDSGNPLSPGWDVGGYPVPKSYTLGISLKF